MYYVGIDIGSISVDTAVLNSDNVIIEDKYIRHNGQPLETTIKLLNEIFENYPDHEIAGIATTGVVGKLAAEKLNAVFVNEVIAQTKATSFLLPEVKTIIEMGGQDSKLIILGKDEKTGSITFEDFAMNSACAAGTGSFLDQQASRMGYTIEEFVEMALKSKNPPRIAGRCSVFAKSDMIHLQQIATPDYEIVAGLCYAVARNFKSSISKGKKFVKPIAFQGGVAANTGVVKAFIDILNLKVEEFIISEHHGTMGAIGAAKFLFDKESEKSQRRKITLDKFVSYVNSEQRKTVGEDKLTLRQSKETYGNRGIKEEYPFPNDEDGNIKTVDAYLGIDVGSLSTNVVVIDREKRVIASRYLMTAGRPIEAVREGIREIGEEVGDYINIIGAGTTGSGRYLTGDFIGADVVRNEITAQARAAIHIDPTVDTIFEIGGQDSKFISIDDSVVVDFEMNKVCAAGTGSFLEEQAERLGINIKEQFGDMALSCDSGCKLGERCTVFMETDVVDQQQAGASREEIVAGLSYSIVHNYLNKVVEDRRVGDNIFFQGGTAANLGVVAAFEKVTGKKITVPPYHDVTGAIGAAILAMETMKPNQQTKFKGFDLSERKYTIDTFICKHCPNHCEVRKVTIEDEKPLFYGHRCERYEVNRETSDKGEDLPDLFAEREAFMMETYTPPSENSPRKKIGFPRALSAFYQLFPFWSAFFDALELDIVLSDATNNTIIHDGTGVITAETCFPVKVAHGHVKNILKKEIDYIFLPQIISMKKHSEKFEQSYNCPYVQALPDIIKSAINLGDVEILRPIVKFKDPREVTEKELIKMGKKLGKSKKEILNAFDTAEQAQSEFNAKLQQRGKEVLASIPEDEKVLVLISRPYNGCDSGVNLRLPDKIRDMGVLMIPMDFLELREEDIGEYHPNMYWYYGQRILAAADIIRKTKNLFGIYLTNFSCGPDSFISHFFRERMKGKPYLQLEIDEHSADAGVITRCEAFLDSLEHYKERAITPDWIGNGEKVDLTGKVVYMPNMADHSYALTSAMRAFGVDAEVIPESDEETLKWGLKYTSGKECYPCLTTTGDIIKLLKQDDFDPEKAAIFMPLADGPCRFGQYSQLQRIVLDNFGYENVDLISPNSRDSYSTFPQLGTSFQKLAWKALLASDILTKLKREIRPYEQNNGETDRIYQENLKELSRVVENKGDIYGFLKTAKKRFGAIPVDKSQRKPIVGIVGEIYVRSNRFCNDHLVEKVEALGGEAWIAPLCEWILYMNITSMEKVVQKRAYWDIFKLWLKDKYQHYYEGKYYKLFRDTLKAHHEIPIPEVLDNSHDFLNPAFGGEAILTIGKAIDYIEQDLAGIINVMPFTCMPGTVTTAISKRVREEYDNVPWLNIAYDAQTQDNSTIITQLEAFMHQAREYENRRKGR